MHLHWYASPGVQYPTVMRGALAVTIVVIPLTMVLIGHVTATLYMGLGFVLFAAPGILLLVRLSSTASRPYPLPAILFAGSVLGFVITSSLTTAFAYLFGFHRVGLAVLLLLVTLATLAWAYRAIRRYASAANSSGVPHTHRLLLLASILSICLALLVPYRSFGNMSPHGLAFSELHKTDLLHHMTTFIALAKGIPPQNPYFSGEPLHYYWLSHVYPASVYALSGYSLQPRDIIVLTGLVYSILFMGVLWVMLYTLFPRPIVLSQLLLLSVMAYGYNYFLPLARWILTHLTNTLTISPIPFEYLLTYDRGQHFTGYSHGWFRSFMVEPHTTFVFAIMLSVLCLSLYHGFYPRPWPQLLIQSTLIAYTVSVDTFAAVVFIAAWIALGIRQLTVSGDRLHVAKVLILVVAMVATVVLLMLGLQILTLDHRSLIISAYMKMLLFAPLYFLVDYGPTAILATIGLVTLIRSRRSLREHDYFFIYLAIVSLFFMFFVRYPDVGTQVFRKGALTLRVSLTIFAACGLMYLFRGGLRRARTRWAIIPLMALAIPTQFMDVYKISHHDPGPDVHYVAPADLTAYNWIRTRLPENAVVQDLPIGISAIPAFAERRTALGDWVHAENYQIGTQKVMGRHQDIYRRLFHGADVDEAVFVLQKYGIQYVYVGSEALRRVSSHALQKYGASPDRLAKVYSRDGVVIYEFKDKQW